MLPTDEPTPAPALRWDVFCRVVDNFGDIGVCWRLCADLAARGHTVRLWVDDASALAWMAPDAPDVNGPPVQLLDWAQSQDALFVATLARADVWIEAFGCEIAPEFIAATIDFTGANGTKHLQPCWINLEYLSAEPYVERCHALPSPMMQGPAKGWTKHFFYPGFTHGTGGLLREPDLMEQRATFDAAPQRADWLAQRGIAWTGQRLVSLFCYEPSALPDLLAQLQALPGKTMVLVTPGRASAAVHAIVANTAQQVETWPSLEFHFLEPMAHSAFDRLLWLCDLNCVRGEDSLVRAIWAGKPLLWQIYPQDDNAHWAKLDAWLNVVQASPTLRAAHQAWNRAPGATGPSNLHLTDLKSWAENLLSARQQLLEMDDLVTQLLRFVQKQR